MCGKDELILQCTMFYVKYISRPALYTVEEKSVVLYFSATNKTKADDAVAEWCSDDNPVGAACVEFACWVDCVGFSWLLCFLLHAKDVL